MWKSHWESQGKQRAARAAQVIEPSPPALTQEYSLSTGAARTIHEHTQLPPDKVHRSAAVMGTGGGGAYYLAKPGTTTEQEPQATLLRE